MRGRVLACILWALLAVFGVALAVPMPAGAQNVQVVPNAQDAPKAPGPPNAQNAQPATGAQDAPSAQGVSKANGAPDAPCAPPAQTDLNGVWEAKANGSKLEAFVAQKGSFLMAVSYVTQPDGKISTYHMGGFVQNGRVYFVHRDGYVFDGRVQGPDAIRGALTIKSYLPQVETTATRRKQGRLTDEHASQFLHDMMLQYPEPGK